MVQFIFEYYKSLGIKLDNKSDAAAPASPRFRGAEEESVQSQTTSTLLLNDLETLNQFMRKEGGVSVAGFIKSFRADHAIRFAYRQ